MCSSSRKRLIFENDPESRHWKSPFKNGLFEWRYCSQEARLFLCITGSKRHYSVRIHPSFTKFISLCIMTVILNLWCCLWQCYIFTMLLNPAVSHLWSLRLHRSGLYWQLLAVSWCFHGMSGGSFQGLWSFGYSGIYDSSYQVGFQTTTIEFPAWLSHVGLFDFS